LLRKAAIYLLCFTALAAGAQSRKRTFRQREIGIFAGGAYYLGDLNPRIHFLYSKPAIGAYFRYTTNYRYAFRFGVNYSNLYGDDQLSSEPEQKERNLNFHTETYEAHAIAEFNFVDYRISHEKHRFTLFIFAGIGGYYFDPQANLGRGSQSLRPFHFEGKVYPRYQICVPFGVGLKWNIGTNYGMGVEWGPRMLFTDYLDDVSYKYPENTIEGITSGKAGYMRGNPASDDWYFYYGLTFTYKLRDPHSVCHGNGRRR
jgi:hypothetical protein